MIAEVLSDLEAELEFVRDDLTLMEAGKAELWHDRVNVTPQEIERHRRDVPILESEIAFFRSLAA